VRSVLDESHLAHVFDESAYVRHVDDTYRRLGLSTVSTEQGGTETARERPQQAVEAGIGGGLQR
jgi:hypothetical protein